MSRPSSLRGYSLFELTIAIAIAAVAMVVVQEVVATTSRTQAYIHARNSGQARAEKIVADLRAAGIASRRVFQDDAEGNEYLAALDMTAFPLLAGARLPVIDSGGRLDPDTAGTPRTGNAMILVCEDAPFDVLTTSARTRRADIVRFFAVYPTRRTGRVSQALPDRIDLVRFASIRYADRASLDAITDANDLADVIGALRADGITQTWVAGAPIATAFFDLLVAGTIDPAPVATPLITSPLDAPAHLTFETCSATLAPNDTALRVPSFALLDVAEPAFPSGFEVKVVGASGGREVLVRIVLLNGVTNSADAVASTLRIFSARDL